MRAGVVTALVLSLLVVAAPAAADNNYIPASSESLVEVTVPDRDALDGIVAQGYDLAEYLRKNDDGTLTANVYGTDEEIDALRSQGFAIGDAIETNALREQRLAERDAAVAGEELAQERAENGGPQARARSFGPAEVTIQRVDYFVNFAGRFLSVEARTNLGTTNTGTLALSYTSDGTTYSTAVGMSRFVDANQYMYHRQLVRIPAGDPTPTKVRVASSFGGVSEGDVSEWLSGGLPPHAGGYLQGFFSSYMDPTQVYTRFDQLAQEFPNLAEIVNLPIQTNGYQRKAQGTMNGTVGIGNSVNGATAQSQAVVLTTKAWGHEGGNDVFAELKNPGAANQPLSVSVNGMAITVGLATNATGALSSTAAQVVAAVNADPAASALVTAQTYRNNAGAGITQPRAQVRLSDFLAAPASVQRGPFQPRVLRIGSHRDGSKVGVFLYCQQHAREWVTPITCLETAERLLRNYATDPDTRELVDNLDIFILPSANPDGSHYSFYDFPSQRKNMTNYCPPANQDPASRNGWGVDLNRNDSVGTIFQGYDGASSSCTSEVFAGPSSTSEPEIKDIHWVVDTFSNIKFSNNIHTYGGYFMWSPGAYIANGRVTLPAPNIGIEKYFFQAADRILNRIKEYRGTALLPQRTGPIADVLYSAAGNSADDQWYRKGIIAYSFEAGSDLFTSTSSGTNQTPVGFMPNFATEGRHEAMEFANGNQGLLESALEYSRDVTPPVVEAESSDDVTASQTPINVRFKWINEASVIHYTTDGSMPTLSSPTYEAQGPRQPGQIFTVDHTTTFKWLAVDIKGNTSDVGSKTFFVETDAPVTTATLNPAAPNGQDGWYITPVQVSLSALDGLNGSGVDKTEYRVDGGNWQTYSGPFSVGSDGNHTVGFRSTDKAGNVEVEKTTTFKVDNPILGTRQLGPSTDTLSAAQPEAYRNVATASGAVDYLKVYVENGTTAGWLVAGIYADNAGHPGALLAQSDVPLTRGAWNTVSLPVVQLAQGQAYWIAVEGAGGVLKIRASSGGHGTSASETGKSRTVTLPATWRTDKVFLKDGPMSAYTTPTGAGGGGAT